MELNYYLLFILALLAEIIGTVSGFGSSILFVPLASLFFDFNSVLGITAVFHVFSNISKIVLFKKGVDKRLILKLGIPAVIFVIIGAILTKHIPQKESELLMNIMLVFFAFFLVYKINSPIEQNDRNLIIGGISSGFLAGLIGTGGALRGLTLAAFNLPKNIYISTSAIIDLGVDLSRSIVYIYNGYFLTKYIIYIPFLIMISVLGSWIGKIILTYISELYFKYIVIIIIIITCLFQVIKYFY
ncbi:MAG: sulfite exporter TauE/SafE family protein [Bacteroidota bacterium]